MDKNNPKYGNMMDALTQGMAEMKVKEITRPSRRLKMPLVSLVASFMLLIAKMSKCSAKSAQARIINCIAFFGTTFVVIAKIWELLEEHKTVPDEYKPKYIHLLWTFAYMKQNPSSEKVLGSTVKLDTDKNKPTKKTLRKWIRVMIKAISDLEEHVIKWDNRFTNDIGNNCLVGVDCIDIQFMQMRLEDVCGKERILNKC